MPSKALLATGWMGADHPRSVADSQAWEAPWFLARLGISTAFGVRALRNYGHAAGGLL